MNDLLRRAAGERRQPLLAERVGVLERVVRVQVSRIRAVVRAGNVSAYRVDGLVFAAKPVRSARIDQRVVDILQVADQRFDGDRGVAYGRDESRGLALGDKGGDGKPGADPRVQPAIEHG